jgi:hypothetical protein
VREGKYREAAIKLKKVLDELNRLIEVSAQTLPST